MTVPDPRASYDALHGCPLGRDDAGRWVVVGHADALDVVTDPASFSSAVSRFLQVPNGLDGDAHREARRLLDPFFSPQRMDVLAPHLADIAAGLVDSVPAGQAVDAVSDLGAPYAVRAQSVWLGWTPDIEPDLLAWMEDNHAASRSGDLARTADVAARFDAIIRRLLDERSAGDGAADVTAELLRLRHDDGTVWTQDELVSVLRNWTGGDLGSLALCAGVVCHFLATHRDLADDLRTAADADVDRALDEILRIDDPFVSNRRRAVTAARVGGQDIAAGDTLVVNWTAANRDPSVFADPDAFDPEANAAHNLVYGAGPHVCPGRPLATLELRVLVRAILDGHRLRLDPTSEPEREQPPVGGFRSVRVILEPR